jgi:hypothetical protein
MKKTTKNTTVFLFLSAFVLLSVRPAQAQTASKAVFENAIITDFCDTFSKASSHITKDNMTAELGMMILPLFSKYKDQIESEWGLYASNTKDIRSIGEKIGQLATLNCPAFQTFIKANLQEIVNDREEGATKTISGKITKVEGSPFTYLQVQNNQGRTDKIYWMEFFPGAEKLSSSSTSYLNKPLRITYKETEVYQAAEKDYRTIKVITRVEF